MKNHSSVMLSLWNHKKRIAVFFLKKTHLEFWVDYLVTWLGLRKFIARGKEYEKDDKYFAVFSMSNIPLQAKFHALLTKTMQIGGFKPLIINHNNFNDAKRYFALFGFEHYIEWNKFLDATVNKDDVQSIFDQVMPNELNVKRISECYYREIPVGKYALSRTCRSLKYFPVDMKDPSFCFAFKNNLHRAIASILAAEALFKTYPIQKILLRDIGYIPSGPILDTALRLGIDCLVIANAQRKGAWIFKRYLNGENVKEHEFSISKKNWDEIQKLPWTEVMNQQVEMEFAARYAEKSEMDTRRLQSGKTRMTSDKVRQILELDPAKKTAVIFAHISWDGAFFFGKDLFESFDDWLVQTTRCAIDNPNLNWIVKLHPLNILKHAFEGRREFAESEMLHLAQFEPLPSHVKIMHSDTLINTYSLFSVIDYGLTVRGTIGLELPCFGIPVVTAGTGRYEDRGFTIDPSTQDEYFATLKNLHKIPRLSHDQIVRARKHYYHLILRRQISFEDIAPMKIRQLNEADSGLFNNITINAKSLEDMLSKKSIQAFCNWTAQTSETDFFTEIDSL